MNNKIIAENKEHLVDLIFEEIKKNGQECNLNHIDISKITDLSRLFSETKFNGDISEWDTSNVTNMYAIFRYSVFNGDISKWDVSRVSDLEDAFHNAQFNRYEDLNNWKPYSLCYNNIFDNDELNDKVYWTSQFCDPQRIHVLIDQRDDLLKEKSNSIKMKF